MNIKLIVFLVNIAGVKAVNQTFAAVTQINGSLTRGSFDGIFGMAFKQISELKAVWSQSLLSRYIIYHPQNVESISPNRILPTCCRLQRILYEARSYGIRTLIGGNESSSLRWTN